MAKRYSQKKNAKMTLYQIIERQWNQLQKKYSIEDTRDTSNVIYRQAYMMACLENTNMTCVAIGKFMNRDHATIVYAKKQHFTNMNYTTGYAQIFKEFSKIVEGIVVRYGINENEALMDILKNSGATSQEIVRIIKQKNRKNINRIEERYVRKVEQLEHENKILKNHSLKLQSRINELDKELKRISNLI